MMYPLSLSKMVETLKYYRDEILGILGRLVPGHSHPQIHACPQLHLFALETSSVRVG